MKTQIYTMQTPEEALAIAELGVDHLGITPSEIGLPGEVDYQTARNIVNAVKNKATCVALSVDNVLKNIVEMVQIVQPDILHLCALEGALPPVEVQKLRELIPGVPIMQAISVAGPEAIDAALAYQETSDYIILDTQAADIDGIGASGEVHDWNISKELVNRVSIPVILAGGLSPENVAEAIDIVKPWGVDSLTHTNEILPDGGFRKDLFRIRQFVKAARAGDH
ncbi:MAG: phosphoribosylanthranilate isomerase [Anaerolineaceae bacterium]|nr:phosphoribosylanthranilate isomerase [Anaerolineaceae bacterium]